MDRLTCLEITYHLHASSKILPRGRRSMDRRKDRRMAHPHGPPSIRCDRSPHLSGSRKDKGTTKGSTRTLKRIVSNASRACSTSFVAFPCVSWNVRRWIAAQTDEPLLPSTGVNEKGSWKSNLFDDRNEKCIDFLFDCTTCCYFFFGVHELVFESLGSRIDSPLQDEGIRSRDVRCGAGK